MLFGIVEAIAVETNAADEVGFVAIVPMIGFGLQKWLLGFWVRLALGLLVKVK